MYEKERKHISVENKTLLGVFVFFQRDNCLLIALHFKTAFVSSSTQGKLLVTSSRLMT